MRTVSVSSCQRNTHLILLIVRRTSVVRKSSRHLPGGQSSPSLGTLGSIRISVRQPGSGSEARKAYGRGVPEWFVHIFSDHSLLQLTLYRSPYQTLRSATLFLEYRWYCESRPWLRIIPSYHRVVENRHYSHYQHRCARTVLSRRCFSSVTGCYCYCIAC